MRLPYLAPVFLVAVPLGLAVGILEGILPGYLAFGAALLALLGVEIWYRLRGGRK